MDWRQSVSLALIHHGPPWEVAISKSTASPKTSSGSTTRDFRHGFTAEPPLPSSGKIRIITSGCPANRHYVCPIWAYKPATMFIGINSTMQHLSGASGQNDRFDEDTMKSEVAALIVGLSLMTPTPAHAQADLLTGILLQAMPAIMALADKAMRPNPQDRNEDERKIDSIATNNNTPIKTGSKLTIKTSSLHYATTTTNIKIDGDIGGGGKISALSVDGSEAPFHHNGHFSFTRAVPIGESRIRLVARDEWGQSAQIELSVTRSQPNSGQIYAPLNPGRSKGAQHQNRVSLIVGIEKYEDVSASEFSDRDALLFYDYAVNEIGIPPSNVLVITNERARRRDIDKAVITWLKPQIVRGETEVLIFFSGHGLAAENGELFLVPADGDPNLLERSAVRRSELVEILVGSGAKSVTLFLDTCYSGFSRTKNSLIASSRPISIVNKTEALPPNVSILAASANDQVSSSLPQARHGLFSYHLMKGIEGGAAQNSGSITLEDLSHYLEIHVPISAAKLGRTQSPQLIGDGSLKVVKR